MVKNVRDAQDAVGAAAEASYAENLDYIMMEKRRAAQAAEMAK